MNEMNILKTVMLALAGKATVFRQNVGQGWIGAAAVIRQAGAVRVNPGDVVIRQARPLHAGLIKGSSDLIGWTPVCIRQEHVGKTMALFTAIEAKSDAGLVSGDQANFIDRVNSAGGLAGAARSPEEALRIVSKYST